ncbi:hypothetical protein OE903_02890 [Bacillus sp. B6(2022)]|nr:hypothetical protein [Bacillus sp. B6(2022)]
MSIQIHRDNSHYFIQSLYVLANALVHLGDHEAKEYIKEGIQYSCDIQNNEYIVKFEILDLMCENSGAADVFSEKLDYIEKIDYMWSLRICLNKYRNTSRNEMIIKMPFVFLKRNSMHKYFKRKWRLSYEKVVVRCNNRYSSRSCFFLFALDAETTEQAIRAIT